MHAYSSLFNDLHGVSKGQLVHELSMLLLSKRTKGDESPDEIYAGYNELREMFSGVVED
jgi:hypothetical protein